MSVRWPKSASSWAIVVAAMVAVGLLVWGISVGDNDDSAGNPESELSLAEATAPLPDAPPALQAVREQANEILGGGREAFEARLDDLEGIPVVVNKWASWCGPCREEFPMFQSQAIEHERDVAFLGLLSDDGVETGAAFLGELPVPYPSYDDPDKEIANAYEAGREFPSTLIIDAEGEVAYTKYGPYTSEDALASDIERYAQ